MRALVSLTCLALATIVAGCDVASGEATATAPATALRVAAWPLPAPDGAAQPDLVAAPDGTLLLSWIEPRGEGHVLRFARHGADGWSTPRTIGSGDDWFVNWADTPHLAATADGALWAHWLRKSAAATYAYDVVLTRSADGGDTWSDPFAVNQDGTPTEHGFVAMWPAGESSLGIAWLDGRATGGGHGGHEGHGGGMMTLRTARFDASLARHDETRLDASACDCCQTSAAMAAGGSIVAYRDRTQDEIRDIAVVRQVDGQWRDPRIVHADAWEMPACPVNGPALDARGDAVVVAWYTAAGGMPRVRVAGSEDGGASFDAPVDLDAGAHVQGRLAVALGDRGTWIAWLRVGADGQSLQLARFSGSLANSPVTRQVATLAGRGRGTGFPQVAVLPDSRAYLAWTEIVDGQARLRGAAVTVSR